MKPTAKIMPEREIEKSSPQEKKIMRDARQNDLWYVTFAPEPETLREKFSHWLVTKLTPEWSLISESESVEIPYTPEDIGEAFRVRLEEYRKNHKGNFGENIMILRLGSQPTTART